MFIANPVSRVLRHLLVAFGLLIHPEAHAGENNAPNPEASAHRLSARAKDVLVAETERFLRAMRSVEHKAEVETLQNPNDGEMARKRAADRLLGIYCGWTSEVLTCGKGYKGGIRNGAVTPSAMSKTVLVNRSGFSTSESRGIYEGVGLVVDWQRRISTEYQQAVLQRLGEDDGRGIGPEPPVENELRPEEAGGLHHSGEISIERMPSLEALLYYYEVLDRFEHSGTGDNSRETAIEHQDRDGNVEPQ